MFAYGKKVCSMRGRSLAFGFTSVFLTPGTYLIFKAYVSKELRNK